MNTNVLPSTRSPLAAVIDPDAYAAGTYTSDWVSMAVFSAVMAVVFAGDLGTAATVNAKIEEAKDGSGTDAQNLAGKAITELTKVGTDDNKQAVINVRAEELTETFTHVRLSITVATATSDAGGVIVGFDARFEPATQAASVAEVVA